VWHDTAGNCMLTLLPELISVAIDILLVYVDFILFFSDDKPTLKKR
jgi:hypothetical protein